MGHNLIKNGHPVIRWLVTGLEGRHERGAIYRRPRRPSIIETRLILESFMVNVCFVINTKLTVDLAAPRSVRFVVLLGICRI